MRLRTRLHQLERQQPERCRECRGWQPVVVRCLTHAQAADPAARAAVATVPHAAVCAACGRQVAIREYIGDAPPGREGDGDGGGL